MKRTTADDAKVSELIADSERMGVAAAAKKHGVSSRTVERYRAKAGVLRPSATADTRQPRPKPTPRSGLSEADRAEVLVAMKDRYEGALHDLLDRLLELAKTSTNLFHVAGAFKVIHDAHVSARMVDAFGTPDASDEASATTADLVKSQRDAVGVLQGGRRLGILRPVRNDDPEAS